MFTQEDYKAILEEQELQADLSYEDKLNIIEQQAIIAEDMDMLSQINDKRFVINENATQQALTAGTSDETKSAIVKAAEKAKESVEENPELASGAQAAGAIGTLGILGITKLISKLRKKRQEKLQKNQSTKDIDAQLRKAINKKKKLQAAK